MPPLDNHLEQPRRSLVLAIMHALASSLPFWLISSIIVVLGVVFGQHYVVLADSREAKALDFPGHFAAWDGEHYVRIAKQGYSFDPKAMSNVAFFPAYPIAGRFVAAVTGWRTDFSLLVVAYAFLIAVFAAASLYTEKRATPSQTLSPSSQVNKDRSTTRFILLALAFFPTTFYFRMAYTESMFLLEVIVILYALHTRWPFWALAALIGLSTATRASGIALLLPFVLHIWERSATWKDFVLDSIVMVPTACWGLAAYIIFLNVTFGEPLAFAQTQKHWYQRPTIPLAQKLVLEGTFEPIVSAYDPSSECHRLHGHRDPSPLFSMYFANPVFFLLFSVFLAFGAVKGWLNRTEIVVGTSLLLFSYFSKSYDTCMRYSRK